MSNKLKGKINEHFEGHFHNMNNVELTITKITNGVGILIHLNDEQRNL